MHTCYVCESQVSKLWRKLPKLSRTFAQRLRQHRKVSFKNRPTMRAPDWWESARFQAFFLALS
jgi:hypothetical protein